MTDPLLIRPAAHADTAALAALAERTFRDAFARFNTLEDMDAYVGDAFTPDRVQSELSDTGNTFLLVFSVGDPPVGYAKLRDGDVDRDVTGPAPIELQRIYVDPDVIGDGVGTALLRACFDTATSLGKQTLWLGVWERNERALAFYERWNFERVGSHPFLLGKDNQTDIVMQRAISDDTATT